VEGAHALRDQEFPSVDDMEARVASRGLEGRLPAVDEIDREDARGRAIPPDRQS